MLFIMRRDKLKKLMEELQKQGTIFEAILDRVEGGISSIFEKPTGKEDQVE